MSVEVTQLENGLTVVSQAMPHLESAALGVWVGTGSRAEANDEHGIAHLLEHMAFKGTARRSAKAIAEEIEAVGGELNAATSVETTAYYSRVLRDDVPLALDILADILQNSVFDPIELAREQHVILQEIGAAMDVPDDRVFDLFQEAAFPEQSIGRPILGTVETVKQFRPEAIRAYLVREYCTERMVVAAAGAIDHDRLVADATERFVGFSKTAENGRANAAYRGGENREDRSLQEVQITLGFAGKPVLGKDYFKVQILAAILGGGMSSRLFQTIREERGLCYSIHAFHYAFSDTGLFGIHAATGEEDVAELMPLMIDEIRRVADDADDDEVARAKAQMRAGLLMILENPSARAGQLARQQLTFGRPIPLEETLARIDAVTAADIRNIAGEVFLASQPTLAAIGPLDGLMSRDEIAGRLAAG